MQELPQRLRTNRRRVSRPRSRLEPMLRIKRVLAAVLVITGEVSTSLGSMSSEASSRSWWFAIRHFAKSSTALLRSFTTHPAACQSPVPRVAADRRTARRGQGVRKGRDLPCVIPGCSSTSLSLAARCSTSRGACSPCSPCSWPDSAAGLVWGLVPWLHLDPVL